MIHMDNGQALSAQSQTGATQHITRIHNQTQKL